MVNPVDAITPEFQRGWDAALDAVRSWHESQAKKMLIQARHSRFPKNLEREADVMVHPRNWTRLLVPSQQLVASCARACGASHALSWASFTALLMPPVVMGATLAK